jgi:hypothetical protein
MRLRTLTNAIVVSGLLLLCCGFPLGSSAQETDEAFVIVRAGRQQVEVTTERGSFTGIFQNEAVVYSTGRAAGMLSLLLEGGDEVLFHVVAGQVSLSDGAVTEVRLLLRKDGSNPGDEFDIATVRPAPAPAEDCLIYDLVGPNVHSGTSRLQVVGYFQQRARD